MNNIFRTVYRELTDEEKKAIEELKSLGQSLHDRIDSLGVSRELSIAKTKLEEAVMWATKHVSH